MIARRLVFLFPGFEPLDTPRQVERFRRGAGMAAATWDATVSFPPRDHSPSGGGRFAMPVTASGAGWRTETEIVFCDFGDLILDYAARPSLRRLILGARALADFVATGTFFRYCRVSWRYALFFLFPIVVLLATLAAGVVVALLPLMLGRSGLHAVWSVPLGLVVTAGLTARASRRLHLLTAMDDWAFAYDLCRGGNAALDARVAIYRRTMADRLAATDAQEVVVAAHSLGASLAVVALAGALAEVRGRHPEIAVLTVGSSLLKTALHPAAQTQREAVHTIVVDRRLLWCDVQALSDPISFYRSNPATSLGITDGRTPFVRRISLRKLVKPETFKRVKRNFFRLHRQFVYGVERRSSFSFHMLLLGPLSMQTFTEAGTIDRPPLAETLGTAAAPAAEPEMMDAVR
ncbi:hypothetical protein [Mangrovicella endophytica]|uniref:hypothetical protein n=1 Tax=Mangrovicella endophytica TaxID=2066697 RepID=UPI000C9E535B|nr:hypothetical protein [Mangrovicella endophytica]